MRILSTYLQPEWDEEFGQVTVLMAFDTLVDQKSVVVGITIGKVTGKADKDALASPIGVKITDRAIRHQRLNYPQSELVVFAGVQTIGNAVQRVRNLLRNALAESVLILLCADDKVYDAAFPALCVDLQSANLDDQSI